MGRFRQYGPGRYVRQLVSADGSRHSFRVVCNRKELVRLESFLDDLERCSRSNTRLENSTVLWLGGLPMRKIESLQRWGMVGRLVRRERCKVNDWVERYIEGRPDVKRNTVMNYRQAKRLFAPFIGEKWIDQVSRTDVDGALHQLRAKYSVGYVNRRAGIMGQLS